MRAVDRRSRGSAGGPVANRLQGAWVTDATTCDTVFSKRNGQVTLKRDAQGRSGFIVSGKRVRGTNASCSRVSSKQKGEVPTFLMNCADKMIFHRQRVRRFENDGRVLRFALNSPRSRPPISAAAAEGRTRRSRRARPAL